MTTPHCGDSAKVSCVYAATLQHITEVWVLLDHSCDPLRSETQVLGFRERWLNVDSIQGARE